MIVPIFNENDVCEITKEMWLGVIKPALEMQTPKKPDRWQDGHSCCSNCKRGIIKEDRFCSYCGQAIDWSE